MGCAVRESGKEDPRTKGQHTGAGLRDDPPHPPHTLTLSRYFTGWKRGGNEAW